MKKRLIALNLSLIMVLLLPATISAETRIKPITTIFCQTHVQNEGWQEWQPTGQISGTEGKGYRLEGIRIKTSATNPVIDINYRTHIQNIGWEKERKEDGEMSGTEGQGLRLEAIQINSSTIHSCNYDIYYQVHAENFGWLGWAKNGQSAGTEGYGYRLEAIRIAIVKKGEAPPDPQTDKEAFYKAPVEQKQGGGIIDASDGSLNPWDDGNWQFEDNSDSY